MYFAQLLFRVVVCNMFLHLWKGQFRGSPLIGARGISTIYVIFSNVSFLFTQVGEVMAVDWTWLTKRVGYYSSTLGIVGMVEAGLLQQKLLKLPTIVPENGRLVVGLHSSTASKKLL